MGKSFKSSTTLLTFADFIKMREEIPAGEAAALLQRDDVSGPVFLYPNGGFIEKIDSHRCKITVNGETEQGPREQLERILYTEWYSLLFSDSIHTTARCFMEAFTPEGGEPCSLDEWIAEYSPYLPERVIAKANGLLACFDAYNEDAMPPIMQEFPEFEDVDTFNLILNMVKAVIPYAADMSWHNDEYPSIGAEVIDPKKRSWLLRIFIGDDDGIFKTKEDHFIVSVEPTTRGTDSENAISFSFERDAAASAVSAMEIFFALIVRGMLDFRQRPAADATRER